MFHKNQLAISPDTHKIEKKKENTEKIDVC